MSPPKEQVVWLGEKKEFGSQVTDLPRVWNSFASFFLNKLLKQKIRSQNFTGQCSQGWKCAWESPGVLLKCRFWFSKSVLSRESSFLKAPRRCWCCWSVNHSLSCETIKKEKMLEVVLVYKNRIIYNIGKALDYFVMTCGMIMQIICAAARFACYLVAKSLRVVIHEDVLLIVRLQNCKFLTF